MRASFSLKDKFSINTCQPAKYGSKFILAGVYKNSQYYTLEEIVSIRFTWDSALILDN